MFPFFVFGASLSCCLSNLPQYFTLLFRSPAHILLFLKFCVQMLCQHIIKGLSGWVNLNVLILSGKCSNTCFAESTGAVDQNNIVATSAFLAAVTPWKTHDDLAILLTSYSAWFHYPWWAILAIWQVFCHKLMKTVDAGEAGAVGRLLWSLLSNMC